MDLPVLSPKRAVVFGIKGPILSEEEEAFLSEVQPLGIIVFSRNIVDAEQFHALLQSLHACIPSVSIWIDQEGGKVARLKPPLCPLMPPASHYLEEAISEEAAAKAVCADAKTVGRILKESGITVNCAPVADIRYPDAHDVIGSRAYSQEAKQVAYLARKMAEGLESEGIIPVIKHIPGHGRAKVDSHEALPIVDVPLSLLENTDFVCFQALRDFPLAMTAHVVCTALDPLYPATFSPTVVRYIREVIGFSGLLVSDALEMKALQGTEKVERALAAGIDIILHCNGNLQEMKAIAANVPSISARIQETFFLGKRV